MNHVRQTQNRGEATERIKKAGQRLLDMDITTKELRLMVYLDYLWVNSATLDPVKISKEEKMLFSTWKAAGYVTGGASDNVKPSKLFYNACKELIYLGYVDLC